MANAAKLALREPLRILLVGYPGAGKTGALASLVNAGYKIRYIDFDGNFLPLLSYSNRDMLRNVDIVTLEDKMRSGGKFTEPAGLPTAFVNAWKLLDRWKYTDDVGYEVDLGSSKDWGCDTIVVIDSLTAMGEASMRRTMSVMNKTPLNMTQQAWGLASQELDKLTERLTSKGNKHHVIVLSHLKIISPKEAPKDASEEVKDQANRLISMIPSRLFPSALGQQLPQTYAGHFPITLEVTTRYGPGSKVARVINHIPRAELDLKLPTDLPSTLDISTGLAQIFEKLAPPLAECTSDGMVPSTLASEKGTANG